MTTDTDIANRALQLIGARTNMASLAENSNEAIQTNIVYASIRDWCLGVNNWNFARRTVTLTSLKGVASPASPPWVNTSPSPPWKYEYLAPTDAVMIRYVTNSDAASEEAYYLGEPKRFVVAVDTISTVDKHVILTNEAVAIAIYTAQMTDPTFWPWYFERLMVSTLASTLCMVLTGRDDTAKRLSDLSQFYLTTAIQANLSEGLYMADTTPEWIQALGLNYPLRRDDGKGGSAPPTRERGNDNGR